MGRNTNTIKKAFIGTFLILGIIALAFFYAPNAPRYRMIDGPVKIDPAAAITYQFDRY
ncbi:MAG: hypothetical protein JWM68_3219, partial [Verrucomicrobiales bacterium]|nr:hypothetical protein [Verrucomicrobiales bacterium]